MSEKKPLKLLVLLTKRQPPSSRLRFTACFNEFRKNGVEPEGFPIPSGLFGRLKMLQKARQADVVVIQKKTSFGLFELKLLRWANPNLIFDMDDAVMFHELEHRQPLNGKNLKKFIRTVDHCKAVVAGNAFLARFAEPNCERVFILPTPVNVEAYKLKDYSIPSKTVTVGWLGVGGNLRYLTPLVPVFQKLAEKYPEFQLKIVSNDFIDIPGVRVIKEKWTLAGELESLRGFDIGIMPLDDSLWARGKCGYKILQYFGVGVPVVASPVGINADFVQDGVNGFLARTAEDWSKALEQLISSRELRQSLGKNGSKYLIDNCSLGIYSVNFCNYLFRMV